MSVDTQTLLGGEGPPRTFEHNGRTYTVSLLTQKHKAAFEDYLKRRAMDTLRAMRGYIGHDEHLEDKKRLMRDIATGIYAFHGEVAAEALATPDGSIQLAAILFGTSHEDMAKLLVDRGAEVREILDAVMAESSVLPNRGSPTTETTGE